MCHKPWPESRWQGRRETRDGQSPCHGTCADFAAEADASPAMEPRKLPVQLEEEEQEGSADGIAACS